MNRRQLGLLALGALIVLDVILVALAIRPVQVVPNASLPPLEPGATATGNPGGQMVGWTDDVKAWCWSLVCKTTVSMSADRRVGASFRRTAGAASA